MNNQHDESWKLIVLHLKNIAHTKGITYQQIADITGLRQANVSRVFALKYAPTLSTLLKIAQALNINLQLADQEGVIDFNAILIKSMADLEKKSGSKS